ncbi:MAG: hypothetical protein ABSA44_01980 [Bacteroidota bacterium]|jgi:hypothetical protein
MKTILFLLSLILFRQSLQAQDSASSPVLSKYKLSFSYGIYAINPTDINDHISTSNDVFGSTTRTIKSIPEIAATFSLRPLQDNQILLLRGGYMSIQRSYQVSIPETQNTPTTTGYTTGTIKEIYTAYPLSIGVGLASFTFDSQIQIEFIYGLGYIDEETSYTSSTGKGTSYSRSFFSPAYGFRIAGQTTVRFSDKIGLTFELGYRGLAFDEYEEDTSTQPANIKFSFSGVNGSVGLSIIF